MAHFQNFRTALGGFNREDVVRYIEYMNNQHRSQIEQLNTQLQLVKAELAKNGIPEVYVLDLGPIVMDILNEGLDTPIITGLKIEIEIPEI